MPRKPKTTGDHFNDPFPTALRELIRKNKTTQDELKDVLGVAARQSVTGYTDGSTTPTAEKIIAVAKFYGTTPDYLLGFTDEPTCDHDLRFVCDYTGLSEKAVDNIKTYSSLDSLFSEDEVAGEMPYFENGDKLPDVDDDMFPKNKTTFSGLLESDEFLNLIFTLDDLRIWHNTVKSNLDYLLEFEKNYTENFKKRPSASEDKSLNEAKKALFSNFTVYRTTVYEANESWKDFVESLIPINKLRADVKKYLAIN